jgi:enoyl-CoA hydratase/carnithine racemase
VRAKYFLLTAQRITAQEGRELGFVHEIVEADALRDRAWALAREICEQPDVTLRATRALFTQPLKKLMLDNLPLGAAMEGLGSCNHFPTTLKQL